MLFQSKFEAEYLLIEWIKTCPKFFNQISFKVFAWQNHLKTFYQISCYFCNCFKLESRFINKIQLAASASVSIYMILFALLHETFTLIEALLMLISSYKHITHLAWEFQEICYIIISGGGSRKGWLNRQILT